MSLQWCINLFSYDLFGFEDGFGTIDLNVKRGCDGLEKKNIIKVEKIWDDNLQN